MNKIYKILILMLMLSTIMQLASAVTLEQKILKNNISQSSIDIDGIYTYDISTGITKRITTNTASQKNPSISGNRIVWTSDLDIYMYDISTGITKRITTDTEINGILLYLEIV